MKVLDALNWRYAVRNFSDEQIPREDLEILLQAVRMSPSAFGLQPYRLIVISNKSLRKQLLAHSMGQSKVVDCSDLVVFAAQTDVSEHTVQAYMEQLIRLRQVAPESVEAFQQQINGFLSSLLPQQKAEWAHQQAYIALGNLLTSAAMMKIDSCPMTGFDPQGYDQVLDLNRQQLTTTAICALGRRHSQDNYAQLAKVRLDTDEFILRS
ncbi:NAD(P)H-dependent oxidoreductase [Lacimicrobium alkaliphilum]|uniref:NAD(P)H-dependent oxidoreductase n=1 Tax=Lacimicrobium alkaliphilum TaxID=1526571 RepID=A0ABQ1R520_9ALTE|nr:NAD(P)H-dependent oxidoreductase [Lacimicrobium alkaliphilum]GGD54931.1 NAD(P)H-dependent oxidoreductase [Lacimicrobium alkaliphilum]